MVEIRTFEGDADEMAAFTTAMWRKAYTGRMPVPLWQPEFLEWELLARGNDARDYLVAAYDGTRLVGFLPAKPQTYRAGDQVVEGTMGSYLSVDPDYHRQGIALQMHREQQSRHRERNAPINMGYVYLGAAVAQGKKFWLKQPEGATIMGKVGLWARLLDHRSVARFELKRRDAWGARGLGLFQGPPALPRSTAGIRPYRPDDLADCLALVRELSAGADFGYVWDETSLARQLAFKNVAHTLVAEQEGRVAGLINYCHLDLLGRDTLHAGVIDLLAVGTLSKERRNDLLRAALAEMIAAGRDVALILRISSFPWSPLLSAGFVPLPAEHCYIGLVMQPGFPLRRARRLHIHWR